MPKRVAYSLVFIRSTVVARADFGPLPTLEPLGFWEQPQSGNARIFFAVESALKFDGKCGPQVWVIGEEFWTQALSLPASALTGLPREQLRKTIGFDVEALTGLAPGDSALTFTKAAPSDESEHFWVTQIATATQTQIQTAVEAAGSKLAGMIHPGGVPRLISATSPTPWRRIEVWKDATLCITGQGADSPRVHVVNGEVGQDSWRITLSRWISSNPATTSQWLGPQGVMAGQPLDASAKPWTLLPPLQGEALKNWLAQWAKELTSGAPHVPVVEARSSVAFTPRRVALTTAIALICLCACITRGLWLRHDRTVAAQQLSALQAAAHAPAAAVYDPAAVERQRHHLQGLLAALAQQSDSTVVITHVAPSTAGGITIDGQCLPATSVDAFVCRLAGVLPADGWEIAPAEKSTPDSADADGLCQFRLKLSPAPAATSVARGGTP